MTRNETVCVIIAAKNAEETIGRAVRSALAEPEVAEVVVVDDGSGDRTMAAAGAADDGSGRLDIVRFPANRGPSAARNHAISHSRAPLIAILDADDFFFPGRFRPMLACRDWDFIADNIAFMERAEPARLPADFAPNPRPLDLDILAWSGGAFQARGLSVPHPALAERPFAIGLLASLSPHWPIEGALNARHLAKRLASRRPTR